MAVTVTYEYPVAGLVPPTAVVQAKNMVVANIIATANGDTDAVVTHNLNLSAADLASGKPMVTLERIDAAARASLWVITALAADTVTVTKSGAAGGAVPAQLRVTVRRPHSIGM